MNITASKQVGPVSYMVESVERLILILKSERILASKHFEYNKQKDKKMRYVSLSRNLTSAARRDPGRWNVGVILDGDKLSEHYSIVPYSFANSNLATGTNLIVKQITAYENGTYKLNLVRWPAIEISSKVYNRIVDIIESLPEKFKTEHKLIHTGAGKRKVNGTYIKEKYLFNVPHGGPKLNADLLDDASVDLAKHSAMNETEERIWVEDANFIRIDSCITGIILPNSFKFEDWNGSGTLVELSRILHDLGLDSLNILYY